jgi:hypothetical protein
MAIRAWSRMTMLRRISRPEEFDRHVEGRAGRKRDEHGGV